MVVKTERERERERGVWPVKFLATAGIIARVAVLVQRNLRLRFFGRCISNTAILDVAAGGEANLCWRNYHSSCDQPCVFYFVYWYLCLWQLTDGRCVCIYVWRTDRISCMRPRHLAFGQTPHDAPRGTCSRKMSSPRVGFKVKVNCATLLLDIGGVLISLSKAMSP